MNAFEMAKVYYPRLWSLERLQALMDAGRLTEAELEALVTPCTETTEGQQNNAVELGDEA